MVLGMVSIYIVCYLFLAGTGSSAFLIAAAVDLIMRIKPTRSVRAVSLITDSGMFVAPLVVAASTAFLIADLGVPERFYLVFCSPPSIITWGSWGLLVFVLSSAASLLLSSFATSAPGMIIESVFQILATLAAVLTLLYSSVFLSSYPSVVFLNTPLLPVLFTFSALSSGLGLLLLIAFLRGRIAGVLDQAKALIHFEAFVIIFELFSLTAFIALSMTGGPQPLDSATQLISGPQALPFWVGGVFAGMIVPLVVDLMNSRKVNMWFTGAGALCALAGTFALRYAILSSAVRYGLPFMVSAQFWL